MKRYIAFKVFCLCVLATPASAQPMQTTTTYSATISGAQNCQATTLTVTRTASPDATRTWLTLVIHQCAPGSSDAFAGPITVQVSQAIPDSDYGIGRTTETLKTTTSAGAVNLLWTVTPDVHQTYSAQWVNETNGTTAKSQQATDTRSAVPSGTIGNTNVSGLSGYIMTATSATGSK